MKSTCQFRRFLARTFRPVTQTTESPGQKFLTVNGVAVGPFEEEEEGTGVPSDVLKVKGEDPGSGHPRSPALRNDPGTVTIPQYRFNNKTK